jgi:WD40 repeat protein
MNKRLISLSLIAFLVGGCAPAPASPTSPTAATTTQTISPSETLLSTQTAVPTATPHLPLQADGAYLLFIKDKKILTMMGIDGIIYKEIPIPDIGYTNLDKAVSPNGRWLVYFTGRIQEPYDFTLNLLDISDGESNIIANLIAPGYPENLRPIAETLELSHYQAECSNVECLISLNSIIFGDGIASLAWSPDSQFLAFAAQIDGPSSDIYLYDTESRTIRRLTDEIEHIWSIKWSPTGEIILYDAALPGPVDPYVYWYLADTRINTPQSSIMDAGPSPFITRFGWITDISYLYAIDTAYYEPMGPGPLFTSIQYINLITLQNE